MSLLERRFRIIDGRQWHFRTGGDGPLLIIVPPPPFDGRTILSWSKSLTGHWTVLIPDAPGCGGSDARHDDSLDAHGTALVSLAAALLPDDARCLIWGESQGSALALKLANGLGSRVRGVVAFGAPRSPIDGEFDDRESRLPSARPCWNGSHLTSLWGWLRERHCFNPWYRRHADCRILAPLPPPLELAAELLALLSAPDQGVEYDRLLRLSSVTDSEWLGLLADCSAPILLAGGQDFRDAALPCSRLAPHIQELLVETRSAARVRALEWLGRQEVPATKLREVPELPARSGLSRHYVAVAGGQMHYLRGGPKDGVPLLIQHDAASSVGTVRPIVESLARSREIYAFDLPGSGDSDDTLPEDPVPIDIYAVRIEQALATLGLGQVDFYGMWGGGFVGLELARLYPSRVRRLVLSNLFFHEGDELRRFQDRYTPEISPLWHGGHLLQAWHQMRDQGLFYPWFDTTEAGILRREPFVATWMVHERVCSLLKAGNRYRSAYQAHFLYPTLERLSRINVPTLVATAEWDPNRPHTERAAYANPHCEFKLLDPDFRRWGEGFTEFLDRPGRQMRKR